LEPRFLTDLQFQVMQAVWAKPEGATPREAFEAISASGRRVTYRTVLTTAIRLKESGVLQFGEPVGRSRRYRAVQSRQEYAHELVSKTVDRLTEQLGGLALKEIRATLRAANAGKSSRP
jgi:predicted transcriptional regulator